MSYARDIQDHLSAKDLALVAQVRALFAAMQGPGADARRLQFKDECFKDYCEACGRHLQPHQHCYCTRDD